MSSILNMTQSPGKFIFGQNVPKKGGNILSWHKRNETLCVRVDAADTETRCIEEMLTAEAIRIGLIKSSNGRRA
jgi:hypothetical protein